MRAATGARTGTGTWLVQRATALVLALALPVLFAAVLLSAPFDHAGWQAFLAATWVRVLALMSGVALALHAWIGMRDVCMDYVRPAGARLAVYLVVIATLAGSVVWLAAILWGAA